MRLGPALVLCAVLSTGCSMFGDGTRDKAVDANEALVRELPIPPGAVETGRDVSPVHVGDRDDAASYTTLVSYTIPARPTKDLLDFYRSRMPGWTASDACCGGNVTVVAFERGSASISVNADNVARYGSYEVSVDHRGAELRTQSMPAWTQARPRTP